MYKVIVPFRDKATKKRYEKGDTFSSDNAERIAFLIEQGRLEQPTKETPKQEETKKAPSKSKKGDK
ncbi:hypothetical protein [Bacillus swezeyi]|uniref:Uncharacterized protein n=1 Tax=Bacillus swezeyi TaxID=1925020 RepID=A0A5M8RG56_9BACI|nr:hypothetical protein [Bacillus swezeyi]KAA6447585.1 hypothetical protein DX927_20125 [Bacillus swezeyi]TYS34166.1 hypothetical protein FZC77_17130 [Bacillus swezeyi]